MQATSTTLPRRRLAHWGRQVALACWSIPLVTGVAIFVAWVVTRNDDLWSAGVLTIGVGTVLSATGLLALAVAGLANLGSRSPGLEQRGVRLGGVAALLLSNFPVAFGLVVAVDTIETRSHVLVSNETGAEIDDVRVYASGKWLELGAFERDEAKARGFWVVNTTDSDGPLDLTVTTNGHTSRWSVTRVTSFVGTKVKIVLEDADTIRVDDDWSRRVHTSGEIEEIRRPRWRETRPVPTFADAPTAPDPERQDADEVNRDSRPTTRRFGVSPRRPRPSLGASNRRTQIARAEG